MFTRLIGYFLAAFVPTGLLIGMPIWNHRRTEEALLAVAERNHVHLQSEIILADFRSVAADVLVLADGHNLKRLIQEESPRHRETVANEFRNFAQHKQLYDQIRFINEAGQEIVRVNLESGRAIVVPANELQSKRDRYYFVETMRLRQGELFVSPFDLNVEEGRIEQPPKPTIRFATPILDEQGQRRGIVIVNYLGQKLFDKLARAWVNAAGENWLLNSNGYWLRGSDDQKNWAFMYPERANLTLAHLQPEVWRQLQNRESGQFTNGGRLYTFERIRPVDSLIQRTAPMPSGPVAVASGHEPYSWIVLAEVRPEVMAAHVGRLGALLLPIELGLAAIVAAISYFLARAHLRHEQMRLRWLQSARLAAIGEAMAGLSHESRNALQRSQSGLEMLAKRVSDRPDAMRLIEEVQAAQQYLYQLYETVRGYAAPLEIRRRPTDLRELAEETWHQLLREHSCKSAELIGESNTSDTTCSVDPLAMSQVFRNLLENALAAAGDQPRVCLRWSDARLGQSSALQVSLRDNGPGLSREERQRLFEPFFTTKLHGTGLGLAISKKIIESHGGRIAVGESNGNGAELIVTLPRSSS
jgi:signal transduction histidine kinase